MPTKTTTPPKLPKNHPGRPVFVADDDGHYKHKVSVEPGVIRVCPTRGDTLNPEAIYEYGMPSRVAIGSVIGNAVVETTDTNIYEVTYMEGEREIRERYTVVGDEMVSLPVMDTRSAEFPVSGGLAALTYHSLWQAGLGGYEVHLATGLPYNRFYLPGGVMNHDLINRKREFLLNAKVRNLNPSVELPIIVGHTVIPEGVAGHFDLLLTDQGEPNEGYLDGVQAAPVGFIDIGGNTTDVVVIKQGGRDIDAHRSFTIDAGGLHVEAAIEIGVRADLNMGPDFMVARTHMENLSRTGKIRLRGKVHDFLDKFVDPAKRDQAVPIVNEIRAKVKGGYDLDAIYLMGGGSLLLGAHLNSLLGESVPVNLIENADFVNSRGMLKRLKYLDEHPEYEKHNKA